MKELKETVELMTSTDYKERFIAEYHQLKIRYEKLRDFNTKIRASEYTGIEPKHDVPARILFDQEEVMNQYLRILELRAQIEGIELNKEIKSNDTEFVPKKKNKNLDRTSEVSCYPKCY